MTTSISRSCSNVCAHPAAGDISPVGVLRKHLIAAGVTVLSGNVWTVQEQQVVVSELNAAIENNLFLKTLDQFENDTEVSRLAKSWPGASTGVASTDAESLSHGRREPRAGATEPPAA
jgi:hypothetical protein